jgi:hypothetical protein
MKISAAHRFRATQRIHFQFVGNINKKPTKAFDSTSPVETQNSLFIA